MDSNLRIGFCERQHKHLFESIAINPTPSKKACLEPASAPPPVPIPPTTIVSITRESDEKLLSADDIAYHEIKRSFVVPNNLNKESFEYMTFSPPHLKSSYVPNQDDVSKLLKQIPSFTERKPPVKNMGMLFPTTRWILIKINDNPNQSFTTWLPYSTLNTTIACIIHMQDYTAFEKKEMVSHLPLFCLFCLSLLSYIDFFVAPQVIAGVRNLMR